MINIKQFRTEIVSPVLKHLEMYSAAAENLLVGTMLAESEIDGETYLKQMGDGPALGVYQMETATHNDLFSNYLNVRPDMRAGVMGFALRDNVVMGSEELPGNLFYATAMARVHYWRRPEPLPASTDLEGLAAYWKKWWNTELGAGRVEHFIEMYRRHG